MRITSSKKHIKRSRFNLSDFISVSVLLGIVIYLVFANYQPGFLSGWDNLHPEFNFWANVKRSLFAPWQEYQGLGLNGGMAHAADLPRQIILWLFSFVLPLSTLRYFWVFLMLFLGPFGIFFLVKRLTKGQFPALVSAIFYLLNLATIQYFYIPFGSFVSFFGFLPWLLFLFLNYLKSGKRKNLLSFALFSFLATPAFYVQTLFIVYLVFLTVIGLEWGIRNKTRKLKRLVKSALVVLVINAFWLLPVIYFTFTNSSLVTVSHQNLIATPETRYFNEARGGFENIAQLKGYWFDYKDLISTEFDVVVGDWASFSDTQGFLLISLVLYILSILGLLINLFSKKKKKFRFSLPILLFISYFFLASTNPPFGKIYTIVSEKISLFSEIFRSVFTKWSVAFSFVLAVGLGLFVNTFLSLKKKKKYLGVILALGIIGSSIFLAQPAFKGDLFYDNVKVEIPDEYFKAFEYFKNQPKERRIATLPMDSFWGWQYNEWGYRGSGLLWYGIEQPILSRSFDVWSPQNESFYNEASYALYNKDIASFEKVLEKYQVSYLLLDESIINAGGNDEILFIEEFKSLANTSSKINEVEEFGFLAIYETDFEVGEKYVWAPENYKFVNADLTYSQVDPIYSTKTTYIASSDGTRYPFVNLDRRQGVEVSLRGETLQFSSPIETSLQTTVIREDLNEERGFANATNCDLKKLGSVTRERASGEVKYGAFDGGVSCDFFYYPQMDRTKAYVLRIKGENVMGRGLKIYLFNPETKRMDLEELLPEGKFDEYFVILPSNTEEAVDQPGYTLNVETRSFGRVASENIIENIEIAELPFDQLTNMTLGESLRETKNNLEVKEVEKWGTSHYFVETKGEGLLVLGQGYEDGWMAFEFSEEPSFLEKLLPWFFGEPLEHIQVNNWQNGWFANSGSIVVVFWPQYLEWFGLLILPAVFVLWIKPGNDKGDSKI